MTFQSILIYLGLWALIGAAAFSLVVVFLFHSGIVFSARSEEGHLKKKMPLKGLLAMLGFLLLIVAFLCTANYFGLNQKGFQLDFWPLFLLNFGLILILEIYDTLVIDWWVIGRWRPAFLNLPEAMDKAEMAAHIRKSFIVAPLFGLLLALAATMISFFAQ
jgi:hypothetical protein